MAPSTRRPSTQTPATPGSYLVRGDCHSGNGTYNASTGPCEPLTVTKIEQLDRDDRQRGAPVVTSVVIGTPVHDRAIVTGLGSGPTPTGTVISAASMAPHRWLRQLQLRIAGTVRRVCDGTAFTRVPATAGNYAFRATYSGSTLYNASTGPCEPLTVTPPNVAPVASPVR